ncbi:MAG: hypothetical protein HY292_23175, partial [Planctomycetes bacterium]|nr:hypothetical protein [Planctomycetota bacterium]
MPKDRMNRAQLRAVLDNFGIRILFDELDRPTQERIRYHTSRWFRLTETPAFRETHLADDVRRRAAEMLHKWTFDAGEPLGRIWLDDFFGLVLPVASHANDTPTGRSGTPSVAESLRRIEDLRMPAANELLTALTAALDRSSRPDNWVYWAGIDASQGRAFMFELRAETAPSRNVVIEDRSRTVYRVVRGFDSDGLEWLSWDAT